MRDNFRVAQDQWKADGGEQRLVPYGLLPADPSAPPSLAAPAAPAPAAVPPTPAPAGPVAPAVQGAFAHPQADFRLSKKARLLALASEFIDIFLEEEEE